MPEDSELERAIRRVISRVLVDPLSRDLLERMKAYGSPEKFLAWWLQGVTDYHAYAKSLSNREIADSLDYNAPFAKTDMARAIVEEAARRLRDGEETQYVLPVPPYKSTTQGRSHLGMNPDDWQAEDKLRNNRLRVRHLPTRCVFDVWQAGKEVRAVLRLGAAGTELFNEAKGWFQSFGRKQTKLL